MDDVIKHNRIQVFMDCNGADHYKPEQLANYMFVSLDALFDLVTNNPEMVKNSIEEMLADSNSEINPGTAEKTRDSFIMYRSFAEILHSIDDLEVYHELAEAILYYALDRLDVPIHSSVAYNYFRLMKPQFDANYKRYKNGCKPKKANSKQNESKQ